MTRSKPSPSEMPAQIASTTPEAASISVSREETRSSSSRPRRCACASAASWARSTARAAWRVTSTRISRSSAEGRRPLAGEPTLRMPSIEPSEPWKGTKISSSASQASGASLGSRSMTTRLPDCVSQSSSPS